MSKKKVPIKTGDVGDTQLERKTYFCINDMEERASIYVPYIVERVIEGASYSEKMNQYEFLVQRPYRRTREILEL